MCVIIAVIDKDKVPTLDMLKKCGKTNDDGAGVAWLKGAAVRWHKGLNPEGVFSLTQNLPVPYMIHFRLATSGGYADGLCHPFPVTRRCSLELTGEIHKGRVLMHNGCWAEDEWMQDIRRTIIKRNIRLPGGDFSDSRAMAWLAHVWGDSILSAIPGKMSILGPNGIKFWGDWVTHKGMFFSNTSWKYDTYYHGQSGKPYGSDAWDADYEQYGAEQAELNWETCGTCCAPLADCKICSRDFSQYQPLKKAGKKTLTALEIVTHNVPDTPEDAVMNRCYDAAEASGVDRAAAEECENGEECCANCPCT